MPETHDPDRDIEEAKASLMARMEELGRRITEARQKLDIPAHIAAHPRLAVGIAFGVGVLLGIPGGKKRSKIPADAVEVKSGLMGAAIATMASIAFSLIKDVALRQVSGAAKDWWDQRAGRMSESEEQASRTRAHEAFLEH